MTNNYDLIIEHIVFCFKKEYIQNTLKVENKSYIVNKEYYLNEYDVNSKDLAYDIENKLIIENTLNDFKHDLTEFLVNDIPFKLHFNDSCYEDFYQHSINRFFQSIMSPIYYGGEKNIQIELKTFKKLINLFKNIMVATSIDSLFPVYGNSNIEFNPYHLEFSREILSFNNKIHYSHENTSEFWELIRREISGVAESYNNQKSNLLEEGFINYLKNREEFLSIHKNSYEETQALELIKKVLHCDHWASVAQYFPSYKNRRIKTENTEIFSIDTNPVYCININQINLLNLSPYTVTDSDIFEMMKLICKTLNLTKPKDINTIELSNAESSWISAHTKWHEPRIYLSGKILNDNLINGILKLIQKMIIEFNSENIDKNFNNYEFEERNIKNKENFNYLLKIAEVYWLDLELGDAKVGNQKVSKI
jgi:hypothetical protein